MRFILPENESDWTLMFTFVSIRLNCQNKLFSFTSLKKDLVIRRFLCNFCNSGCKNLDLIFGWTIKFWVKVSVGDKKIRVKVLFG